LGRVAGRRRGPFCCSAGRLADLAEAGDEGVTVTLRPLCGAFDG
jgi:hypothetical protein